MAYQSKVKTVQLAKQLNLMVSWQQFAPAFHTLYVQLYKWLEHHKEDIDNAPAWDPVAFTALLNSVNASGVYPGSSTDLISLLGNIDALLRNVRDRVVLLEQWKIDVDNILIDHEARIAALETP